MSDEIKRYDLEYVDFNKAIMSEDEDGEYVLYDDYVHFAEENKRLQDIVVQKVGSKMKKIKNRIENWLFKIARFIRLIKFRKVYIPKDVGTLCEAANMIKTGMAGPKPSWFNRYYIAIEGRYETDEVVFMPPRTGIYLEDGSSLIGKPGNHVLFNKPPEDACLKMGEIGVRT